MGERNKPAIVIDTNLFISAIISKNNTIPYQLLLAWRNSRFQLITSDPLITEVEAVLKREKIYKKYNISQEEIAKLLRELRFSTKIVIPIEVNLLPIHSRDKKDDILLASALGGNCDYLITGDEDLLILDGHQKLGDLKIIKAEEFLRRRQ